MLQYEYDKKDAHVHINDGKGRTKTYRIPEGTFPFRYLSEKKLKQDN